MDVENIKETEIFDGLIGGGVFGVVHIVNATIFYTNGTTTTDIIARKKFHNSKAFKKEKNANLMIIKNGSGVNLDGIARMIMCRDSDSVMFMEYVTGPTLFEFCCEFIESHEKLSVNIFGHLLSGSIEALKQLHNIGVIHGDVKASNIIVKSNLYVVLIDFSLSTGKGESINGFGDLRVPYQAPELKWDVDASESLDVFSLGVCFINLLRQTHSNFFNADDSFDSGLIYSIVDNELEILTEDDGIMVDELKKFLTACINKNVRNRPNLSQSHFDGSRNFKALPFSASNKLIGKLSKTIEDLSNNLEESREKNEDMKQLLVKKDEELKKMRMLLKAQVIDS